MSVYLTGNGKQEIIASQVDTQEADLTRKLVLGAGDRRRIRHQAARLGQSVWIVAGAKKVLREV